jgi:hypothetical protein
MTQAEAVDENGSAVSHWATGRNWPRFEAPKHEFIMCAYCKAAPARAHERDACSLLGLWNDPEHLIVRAGRQLPAPIDAVETPPARILDCHPSLAEQRPNLRVGDPHIRSSLSSQPVWHGHALVPLGPILDFLPALVEEKESRACLRWRTRWAYDVLQGEK